MSIESDLRKDGIEVISKLDTLVVNSIAQNIAKKIITTFPKLSFTETELFIKLSRINMYTASMPEGMAEANYFYKNSSIYFNNQIAFEDLEEFAIHECIHHLQEIKSSRNKLLRMGLCTFKNLAPNGLGINEAAVQLITAKIIGIKPDFVKYYGIELKSSSPSYYPMECHLLEQMAFVTGYDVLFESTFNSNDHFKNAFIEKTSEKVYYALQDAIDCILGCEEQIAKLTNKITDNLSDKAIKNINKKISNLKEKISLTFMRTQNLIVSNNFNARKSAKRKTYEYSWYLSEIEIPTKERFALRIDNVDLEKVKSFIQELKTFQGTEKLSLS